MDVDINREFDSIIFSVYILNRPQIQFTHTYIDWRHRGIKKHDHTSLDIDTIRPEAIERNRFFSRFVGVLIPRQENLSNPYFSFCFSFFSLFFSSLQRLRAFRFAPLTFQTRNAKKVKLENVKFFDVGK